MKKQVLGAVRYISFTQLLTSSDSYVTMKIDISVLQGLCLVDWGRGIDLSLFPSTTEFKGDCRTSGFRCMEMKENKPWKFQASIFFSPFVSATSVFL